MVTYNKIKRPIGIFDSGVGGLTVFKEIRKKFIYEDLVYFGDTARVPYGPKSPETIVSYSIQNTRFLIQQNAKIIIVACNTSSAVAIPALRKITRLPILDVIKPGAEKAVSTTRNGKIGVIGTEGTVNSHAYLHAIKALNPKVEVYSKACPLFVPLVEEGWHDSKIAYEIAENYLQDLTAKGIDTLVLGCTHYPLLKKVIQSVVGNDVQLVDSAEAIANYLDKLPDINTDGILGCDKFYVSDNEKKFSLMAEKILENKTTHLKKVSLFESWFIHEETD